jgi:hypothetical protein
MSVGQGPEPVVFHVSSPWAITLLPFHPLSPTSSARANPMAAPGAAPSLPDAAAPGPPTSLKARVKKSSALKASSLALALLIMPSCYVPSHPCRRLIAGTFGPFLCEIALSLGVGRVDSPFYGRPPG